MIYKGGGVSKKEKDDYARAIRRNVIESMQVGELIERTSFRESLSLTHFFVAAARTTTSGHENEGRRVCTA